MFAWWGRAVVRLRWWVFAAAVVFVGIGATWGLGVFGALTGGGFDDPGSESSRARQRIEREYGSQDADIVVLYSSRTSTVDDRAFQEAVSAALDRVAARPEVATVTRDAGVSTDRHATYAAIQLRGGTEDGALAQLDAITPALTADGISTEVGGLIPFLRDANHQVESDIVRAELISLPLLLILLVVIFRGVVAATTPLLVGVLAILGAFVATRLIAGVTEVSTFAVNIITMLGLGMAIDYALFVVSRFREELAAGREVPDAVVATLATAGRTVMVSGLTVALSLASLLIFPIPFLRSMGWGGMAAVLVAMVSALTVLPALLAVLGRRVKVGRRRERHTWARLAHSVMRRPVWYVAGVLAVLVLLAVPFHRVAFGGFDERILPEGTPSRTVAERLAAEFPGAATTPILVYVESGDTAQRARQIAGLNDVTSTRVVAEKLIVVGAPTDHGRAVVQRIRALDGVLVGGRPAADLDQLTSLGSRLPWMALLFGTATTLLLFLAFGSVLLPLKAIAMNAVSLGASFGVVVWAFQDGHLAGVLDFTSTGFLEPTDLILMLAVLFGLSTDYEVFLLSRVREEWDRTGDNAAAVAGGLQRTGGIITAAALLLIVVVAGFATGGTATIKQLGVGVIVAILVDALLVRALLVPATMRLLGRWNWWAPGPLARVYRRYGLHEETTEPAQAGERVRA